MFLRLGRSGYQQVLGDCWRVSSALADMLTSTGAFDIVSPRAPEPGVALVAFRLSAARRGRGYDEHDVSDGLRERGWIVPAYPLPAGTEDEDGIAPLVLRVVSLGFFACFFFIRCRRQKLCKNSHTSFFLLLALFNPPHPPPLPPPPTPPSSVFE